MAWIVELKSAISEIPEAEVEYPTLEEALACIAEVIPYTSAITVKGWTYQGDYKWEMDGNGAKLRTYEVL